MKGGSGRLCRLHCIRMGIRMKMLVKANDMNSSVVDIFDRDRVNEHGDMYCVAEGIEPELAGLAWKKYLGQSAGGMISDKRVILWPRLSKNSNSIF